jgi:uncharacterized membrane protein
MLILTMHVLLYVFVILDVPVLRQCIGFVYLTFIPGFVILGALSVKTKSFAVDLSLSVTLSIVFVMFVGLLANTLYPLLGISAPLSTLPLMVTTSVLTLAIFIFSQRKEIGNNSNTYSQLFHAEIKTEGAILCAISISLLSLSIVGALYDSVFMLVSVMAGTAAIFFTSIFLYKRIPSDYYLFVLFAVSLSLLLQTSLISRHIMGWDIFGEYSAYNSVRAAGYWTPPGIAPNYSASADANSILSITILPTVYSTVLNLNGELIFKIIFPFIFCFVPIFLFEIYETQLGKIVALLSVFFFIADPNDLYGLASLSLAREMITYLFLSAMILCFVKKDIDLKTRRVLVITFGAGLAVSHYSFAFVSVFLIVFVFVAMRIFGGKDPLMNLALVLCIVGITFAWYTYVASPPLNNLVNTIHNIASRLTTDLFNPQNRLDPGMSVLSPTSQAASLNGEIHKIVIYISEFFVVVGAIILAIKPKEFKFHSVYRWMAIFAAFLLLVCIAIPNVAPTLNFLRFYRYAMIFLAPLFILGGAYFLGLFKRIRHISSVKSKFGLRDIRLLMLTILLVVFFLYRSGFVSTVTGDRPYSYSLDFNRMKTSTFFTTGSSLYDVYVPEQDLFGARWLAPRIGNNSLVYADYGMGVTTLIDYAALNPQKIDYIINGTQTKPGSYMYLRSFNVLGGMVVEVDSVGSVGSFDLSNLSSSLSQNDRLYSNGASNIYFAP